MNWVTIGSGNGLLPVRCLTITWTNAGLSIAPIWTNFRHCHQNTKIFIRENAFENAVCETVAIFCRGRWVNYQEQLDITVLVIYYGISNTVCVENIVYH